MKNKSLTKLTALVVLVVMIALILVSGTLAKYATEYTGEDTAIVAKWNVSVKDLDNTDVTTFNLFDSTKVYDLANVTDVNDLSTETGAVEADVSQGSETTIGPGTWGKVGFNIVIANDTQVSVAYNVAITGMTNASNIPLEFSIDGKTWSTDPTTLKNSGTVTATEISNAAGDITKTTTLYWRWLYEGSSTTNGSSDETDTTLGKATPTCTISAAFGATQAD